MLPPVLEIYVIWHPDDHEGKDLALEFIEHFRGASFSGIIGGGIHVATRSIGWLNEGDSPQPCYMGDQTGPNGLAPAEYVALIPILGIGMASAVQEVGSAWNRYISELVEAHKKDAKRVSILPYSLQSSATDKTRLGELLGAFQQIAATENLSKGDTDSGLRCRDLSQGLAQFLADDDDARLTVFLSHTKRSNPSEGNDVDDLVGLVRQFIASTRLNEFFDAHDLQAGHDWAEELIKNAGNSALLAVRTDLYASRAWCQREVTVAKTSGMPVVTLDALGAGEERGSFLMDHVPRLPVRKNACEWQMGDVATALNLLTDECLKREVWLAQQSLAAKQDIVPIDWWASHAPEPLTVLAWIEAKILEQSDFPRERPVRVLHPDPPLGPNEIEVLQSLAKNSKLDFEIDIMTPRQLAMRGG
ncbi:MAG: hypothetical protein ACSHXB_17565 [Sulfitobacter sp.]